MNSTITWHMITMVFYYLMVKIMSLGLFSFIINLFFIILIDKNVFGSKIKNIFVDIIKKNFFLYIILYLFIFLFLQ
jgi:hypothetical protein